MSVLTLSELIILIFYFVDPPSSISNDAARKTVCLECKTHQNTLKNLIILFLQKLSWAPIFLPPKNWVFNFDFSQQVLLRQQQMNKFWKMESFQERKGIRQRGGYRHMLMVSGHCVTWLPQLGLNIKFSIQFRFLGTV